MLKVHYTWAFDFIGAPIFIFVGIFIFMCFDSVWASCPDDRRSITSFAVCLRPDLLSSTVKKQAVVSHSSIEAEILWFLHVLQTLCIRSTAPPIRYCDNISAFHLAKKNLISHHHSEHVEIDVHFIRGIVGCGLVHFCHMPSSSQVADFFTEA